MRQVVIDLRIDVFLSGRNSGSEAFLLGMLVLVNLMERHLGLRVLDRRILSWVDVGGIEFPLVL